MLLDNIQAGKRGFLIGGGSSINGIIKSGFKFKTLEKQEITVGVNKAYKILNPNYLVYQDNYIWDTFSKDLKALPKTTEIICPHYAYGAGDPRVTFFNAVMGTANLPKTFDTPIGTKNNVGVTALRISYILGLNPIYLVGIDLRPEDAHPDKFNFHNDYDRDRQTKVSKEKIALFQKYFLETIEELKRVDVHVFSCSKVSTLNSHIPYVDIKNII